VNITQSLFERMFILLGSDTVTLSQTTDVLHLHLAQAPFTPGPSLVLGDLTEADFPGYAALDAAAGPIPQSVDPGNGDSLLQFSPDTGLWRWETTGAVSPSQTIHGFYLTSNDDLTLFAAELLAAPVTLTGINQSVIVPLVQLRQLVGSIL